MQLHIVTELCDVTFQTVISKFAENNWKLSSVKLMRKHTVVPDRQRSAKLRKLAENVVNS